MNADCGCVGVGGRSRSGDSGISLPPHATREDERDNEGPDQHGLGGSGSGTTGGDLSVRELYIYLLINILHCDRPLELQTALAIFRSLAVLRTGGLSFRDEKR